MIEPRQSWIQKGSVWFVAEVLGEQVALVLLADEPKLRFLQATTLQRSYKPWLRPATVKEFAKVQSFLRRLDRASKATEEFESDFE